MTSLWAGDLSEPQWRQLLEELRGPPARQLRCWLEGVDGWSLSWWAGWTGSVPWYSAGQLPRRVSVKQQAEQLVAGRLFAPSGELRWRKLPVLGERPYRTVFLGRDWSLPALDGWTDHSELLADWTAQEESYPLWGQQTPATPGEWLDLRIPHRLVYPVETSPPSHGRWIVKLHVEIWRDRRGQPQCVRLCDLVAKQEP